MKQCPNPHCIIYTRLEELPDAYVKCPKCGGLLVDAGVSSQVLASGHLSRSLVPPALFPGDQEGDYQEFTFGQRPSADAIAPPAPYGYGEEYLDEGDAANGPYSSASSPSPSVRGKVSLIVGGLLLLGICAAFGLLVGNRLLPHTVTLNGPQATEIALAAMRPAVNTPIAVLPTISTSGAPQPNPTIAPPASYTQLPATNPQYPTPITQPPTPNTQPQPAAGVLDAHMSVRLEGGQPVGGDVKAYNPTNTFNLAVQANFGSGAVTSILTRWYGPDGSQIYQIRKEYTQPGAYYAGFTLSKSTPWPTGDYRVDIHTNDSPSPAYSVPFSVVQ